MRAYLFEHNGKPIRERYYYAPGKFVFEEAFCDFENKLAEGDEPLVHIGYGHFHQFVCVAVDDTHALLVINKK